MSAEPVFIYHNPRCSKSRETLALLKENGVEPQVVDYLNNPPERKTLEQLLHALGMEPRQILRTKEAEYKDLRLDNPSLSHEELLDAMISNPRLIERPIVVKGKKAVLGRPPENVLNIL